ncbi:MAG: proline--tRNA ligase [Coriobacteriales bacterium]|jgi:prolyl-tRNA synthetase|nr:proline--tRNA ligase [Coriobacteriales bacterium]
MPWIDARILRLSQLYAPTLKEDPVDAEVASHRLLTRAAMLRKVAAGVYSFLPLGLKVLHKVEQIVREEQNRIGAQEMLMSIIQPAELWHESGRWDVYGPELMSFEDRHGHGFALSPTQEELITAIVRNELRSYRELPKSLYHIQWKYRDEIRPRFGLLRGREFIMKDAYSFHDSPQSLQDHYDEQSRAYGRICDRLGLDWRSVEADSGQIGGKVTREFMALAASGEAEILHCTCGFAANAEVATAGLAPEVYDPNDAGTVRDINELQTQNSYNPVGTGASTEVESIPDLLKVHTPGIATIVALADFLDISEKATVKALAGRDSQGQVTVLFLPGSHEAGDLKLHNALLDFELMSDEEMRSAHLTKGFMGPVGLPDGTRIVADISLKNMPYWLVGANEPDYHLAYAACGRDFSVDAWVDSATAQPGDSCPYCGMPLVGARGIEVGQVFQLGTKYSEAMNARYMDEDGVEKPFIMGCYGWGVTRSLAAVVEQHNDEAGIIWPLSVAPAEVVVIMLTTADDVVQPAAEHVAEQLVELGIEVALDDRDERAGVKFNDADLIGWPYQLVVGKRGLATGIVELKVRATGERNDVALSDCVSIVADLICEQRRRYL